jgi:hypothetical protein
MVAIRILQYWATLASYEEGEGSPILATSDSNIAVDNLVEGCANAGLRVIGLGRPEAVRPELLRFCIDRPGTSSSYNLSTMDTHDGTTQQADNYYGSPSSSLSASSYKEKMKKMKAAQVICCTCIGSGADILDSMSFERVLVDEATQATESAVLVPLTRGCRHLVLVGEHSCRRRRSWSTSILAHGCLWSPSIHVGHSISYASRNRHVPIRPLLWR